MGFWNKVGKAFSKDDEKSEEYRPMPSEVEDTSYVPTEEEQDYLKTINPEEYEQKRLDAEVESKRLYGSEKQLEFDWDKTLEEAQGGASKGSTKESDAEAHTPDTEKKVKKADALGREQFSEEKKEEARTKQREREAEKTEREKAKLEEEITKKKEQRETDKLKRTAKFGGTEEENLRDAFNDEYVRVERAIKRGGVSDADKLELRSIYEDVRLHDLDEYAYERIVSLRKRVEGKTFGSFMEHRREDLQSGVDKSAGLGAKALKGASRSGKGQAELAANMFGVGTYRGGAGGPGSGEDKLQKVSSPGSVLQPVWAKGMFTTPKMRVSESTPGAAYNPTTQTVSGDARDSALSMFGYSPQQAAQRREASVKDQLAGRQPLNSIFGQKPSGSISSVDIRSKMTGINPLYGITGLPPGYVDRGGQVVSPTQIVSDIPAPIPSPAVAGSTPNQVVTGGQQGAMIAIGQAEKNAAIGIEHALSDEQIAKGAIPGGQTNAILGIFGKGQVGKSKSISARLTNVSPLKIITG